MLRWVCLTALAVVLPAQAVEPLDVVLSDLDHVANHSVRARKELNKARKDVVAYRREAGRGKDGGHLLQRAMERIDWVVVHRWMTSDDRDRLRGTLFRLREVQAAKSGGGSIPSRARPGPGAVAR